MPDDIKLGLGINTSSAEKDVKGLSKTLISELNEVRKVAQTALDISISDKDRGVIQRRLSSVEKLYDSLQRGITIGNETLSQEEALLRLEKERERLATSKTKLAIAQKSIQSGEQSLVKTEVTKGTESSAYKKASENLTALRAREKQYTEEVTASSNAVKILEESIASATLQQEKLEMSMQKLQGYSQRTITKSLPTEIPSEDTFSERADLIKQANEALAEYQRLASSIGDPLRDADFEFVGNLASRLEGLDMQTYPINQLREDVEQFSATVADVTPFIESIVSEMGALAEPASEAQASISGVEKELESLEGTVENPLDLTVNAEDATANVGTVEKELESVEGTLENPFDLSINSDSASGTITDLISELNTYKDTLTDLTAKRDRILAGKESVSDSEWVDLNNKIQETSKSIDDTRNKINSFATQTEDAMNNSSNSSDKFLEKLISGVGGARNAMQALTSILRTVGQAAVEAGEMSSLALATATAGVTLIISAITAIINAIETIKNKIKDVVQNIIATIKKVYDAIVNVVKSVVNYISKVMDKIRSSFEKAFSSKSFKKNLTTLLKYTVGVRSLYFAFRKLRSAIQEGLKNLVQFQSETNLTNQRMTEFNTSLLYIKNAWAAAFAPVINVVMPILSALIDMLATVGNAIARFVAALTGQSTVIQALKVGVGDYAKSLQGAGGSAKKAADEQEKLNDRLASFDDLNVLGKDDDSDKDKSPSGGGGGGANMPSVNEMFEKIDTPFSKLADLLKSAWESGDFYGVGTYLGESLKNALIKANTWLLTEGSYYAMKIAHSIGTLIDGFLDVDGLATIIGNFLANGIVIGINMVNEIVQPTRFMRIGEFIVEGINAFIPKVVPKIGDLIGNLLHSGISLAFGFIENANWAEWGESFGQAINNFFEQMSRRDTKNGSGLTGWQELGQGLSDGVKGILDAIIAAINELDVEQIKTAITEFLERIDWDGIKEKLKELWDALWETLGEIFPDVDFDGIKSLLENIVKIIGSIGTAISKIPWDSLLNVISSIINKLAELDWDKLGDAIVKIVEDTDWEKVGNALKIIVGLIAAIVAMNILDKVARFIALFSIVATPIFAVVAPILAVVGAILGFVWVLKRMGEGVTEAISLVEEGFGVISEKVEEIKSVFEGVTFGEAIDYIKSDFKEHWDGWVADLKSKFEQFKTDIGWDDFVSGVRDWKEDASGAFHDTIENIKNKVSEDWSTFTTSVKEKFEQFKEDIGWEDFKAGLSDVWGDIKDAFRDGINGIIDLINGFLTGVQNMINRLGDLLGDIELTNPFTGTSYTIDLASVSFEPIPHLAKGAVIPPNREFMAVLGDQSHGTNIEAPLDTIKQAVAEVVGDGGNAEVIALLSELINVVKNKQLNIGDKEIGRANARYEARQKIVKGTML